MNPCFSKETIRKTADIHISMFSIISDHIISMFSNSPCKKDVPDDPGMNIDQLLPSVDFRFMAYYDMQSSYILWLGLV